MKKTLLLVVTLVSLFAVQVSAIDLSYHFKKGSSYAQSTKTAINIGMSVMGQTINIGTTVNSRLTYTVTSVKDTCYEIDVRYDSIGVSMDGVTGNQNITSGISSAQGKVSDALKQFVNKTFQITLSKKGKVVSVRNYEALFGSTESTGQTDQESNNQISSQLKQSFSKEAFLSNMEAYVSFFPDKSVNKGDSWVCTNKMVTSGFPVETVTTYTLKDITSTQFILSGVSTVNTGNTDGKTLTIQGMNVNMDIKGNISYEMALDKSTGWLSDLTGKINMDAIMNMVGGQAQGQSFTLNIKGDIVSNDR